MMKKISVAIHSKANSTAIDLQAGNGPLYMDTKWPWQYLWLFMTNDSNKIRILEITFANIALSRHQSSVCKIMARQCKMLDVIIKYAISLQHILR